MAWDCDHSDLWLFPRATRRDIATNPLAYINSIWHAEQVRKRWLVPGPDIHLLTSRMRILESNAFLRGRGTRQIKRIYSPNDTFLPRCKTKKMSKLRIFTKTPASLGYSFPPNGILIAATWFSWPRPEGISFPDKYHTVPENLARIMREIAPRERVEINVPNGNYEYMVRKQLAGARVPDEERFFSSHQDQRKLVPGSWAGICAGKKRAGKREAAIVDWGFNAWGGKYPPFDDDDAVPTRIAEELKLPVFYPGIVMEGVRSISTATGTC